MVAVAARGEDGAVISVALGRQSVYERGPDWEEPGAGAAAAGEETEWNGADPSGGGDARARRAYPHGR